jgi:hypothetical protein
VIFEEAQSFLGHGLEKRRKVYLGLFVLLYSLSNQNRYFVIAIASVDFSYLVELSIFVFVFVFLKWYATVFIFC